MRKLCTAVTAVLVLAGVGGVSAQPQQPKPGPEHEQLKMFEGVWESTVYSQGGKFKGTMIWKVDLNGLWLLEHFKNDPGSFRFEGMGAISYDPVKKKYISVWIDSMSTVPMTSTGTYNKDKKMLTMTGKMRTPDGKSKKVIMRTRFKSDDNIVFTMIGHGPDGKKTEMMKIDYKRKSD